jgi:hypothetical protein
VPLGPQAGLAVYFAQDIEKHIKAYGFSSPQFKTIQLYRAVNPRLISVIRVNQW